MLRLKVKNQRAECAVSPPPARAVGEPSLVSSDFIPSVMTEHICIKVKTAEAGIVGQVKVYRHLNLIFT